MSKMNKTRRAVVKRSAQFVTVDSSGDVQKRHSVEWIEYCAIWDTSRGGEYGVWTVLVCSCSGELFAARPESVEVCISPDDAYSFFNQDKRPKTKSEAVTRWIAANNVDPKTIRVPQ